MIKKWNNFIKESVHQDWNYYYNNIKKRLENIIETPDSEYENGVNGKRSDLLHIFENDLKLEDNNLFYNNHITKALNLYTEYVYNDKSKEIKDFLIGNFGDNDKWSDIRDYIVTLIKKNFKEISEIILKILDLYAYIKKDFNNDGYPKQSDLSKKVESVCIDSLDESTLELFDVVESYSNLHIELGYDKDNLNLELLQRITDEVYSVCGRISDSTGLKNTYVEFGDNLTVGFEF
jgi:hypothetical protein